MVLQAEGTIDAFINAVFNCPTPGVVSVVASMTPTMLLPCTTMTRPPLSVGESSNMNLAFVSADGMLKHPKFDHILSGCTSLRLLALAPSLQARNLIKGVQVCDIPVGEARAAREMILIGSSIKVAPIVEWDRKPIGDGKPGPVAKALRDLLEEDMHSARERLIEVPY